MTYDPELSYELMQRLADNPKNNLDFLPNDNDRYENVSDQIWFNDPQGDRGSPDDLVESDFGSFRCEQVDWEFPNWISTIRVNITRWRKSLDLGGSTRDTKGTRDAKDPQNTRIKDTQDLKSTTTSGGTDDIRYTKFTKDTGGIGETEPTIITGTGLCWSSKCISATNNKDAIGNKDIGIKNIKDTGITNTRAIRDARVTEDMKSVQSTQDAENVSFIDVAGDVGYTKCTSVSPLTKHINFEDTSINDVNYGSIRSSDNKEADHTKDDTGTQDTIDNKDASDTQEIKDSQAQATEEPKYTKSHASGSGSKINPHDFLYYWEFRNEPYNHFTRGHSDEKTTLNEMKSIIGMNQVVYKFILDDPQYSNNTGCESDPKYEN